MSQITTPAQLNFIYRFEAGSAVYLYTAVDEIQQFEGESVTPIQITHKLFTNSPEEQELETDIELHEEAEIINLFLDGPPPYPVLADIYEYDRDADTLTQTYRGWVVRANFELDRRIVSFHCKSLWHFFERESLSDSLSALSRYSIYDPRSGVDVESLKETITVTTLNDERDVLIVTGITQPVDWYKGGIIEAPNRDRRSIIADTLVGPDRTLSLDAAFPRFTLATGFTATVYPGDDLTYETWANKFASQTNNGEFHGGWTHTPNVDPAKRGVI